MDVDDPSQECSKDKHSKPESYPTQNKSQDNGKSMKTSKQMKIRDGCIVITSTSDETLMTQCKQLNNPSLTKKTRHPQYEAEIIKEQTNSMANFNTSETLPL